MRTSTKTLTLRLVVVAALASCAEQRPAINRVQVAALEKSFFVGADLRDTGDDPEFFMRGVVVDVGYGAAQDGLFTSTYAQPVSRIKWEITETYLNARLAYERIQGTDGKGNAMNGLKKKASNDGQIVASYRITSHFDIRRAYNSTTGEAYNVLEENSSDRPWYERANMRVDWSQNLATDTYDFDTLSMMGIYGGISYESIPYAITDDKHPDAPHFDLDKSYFDVTVKAFAKPQTIDLSALGWGIERFPSCYLPAEFAGGTAPYGNCNPVELTLRYSFRKVVDNDYEPADWDGYRFQAHGLFTQDYYGYDRKYGMVDNKWFRFASRYNLWERSHYYADPVAMTGEVACATRGSTVAPTGNPSADPNRDVNPKNGTADECEAVTAAVGIGGSRCDVFKGKCTLPTRARTQKTIPWYINGNTTDEDLFEATNWAVQEWDIAMRAAVQVSRLVECRRAGGSDCDNSFPMWSGQQDDYDDAVQVARNLDACNRKTGWSDACKAGVDADVAKLATERGKPATDPNLKAIAALLKAPAVIVLCHNPVIEADGPACGERGLAPRQGDLRYHTVLNIDKPQTPSAWGIMVDADDPISGEKIAASINIWTHVTDLAVQGLADLVRYMNGELSVESITNGKYIHDWVEAEKVSGGTVAALPTMTKADVAKRLAAATKLAPEAFTQVVERGLSAEVKEKMQEAKKQVLDIAAHVDVPSPMQAAIDARLNMARGTPVEAKLLNAPMLQLAGVPGNLPVTGTVKQLASPLQLNNPKLLSQLRNARENSLAKRGACIVREAPEASALTGIADAMKKKFPVAQGENADQARARTENMIRYLKRRFHYAVIAHEMGHSIGMRHNFVSSYGALHYRPQYWQLRTKNGAVTTPCTDASDGASCVGPRYYDPVTPEEQNQLIWMFMQSSVMDYPGDLSQDMIGLGIWDFASARLSYGDTVAVYKSPDIVAGSRIGVGVTNVTDTFGGLIGLRYSVAGFQGPDEFHYSQLQKEYGLISDCYPIAAQAPSWWREDVDGKWDAVLDGKVVAVDGAYKKCRQMPVDYVAWEDLRMPTAAEKGGGYYRGGPSVEKATAQRLRVPYHFATDHWADTGNVSAFRHDNGADPYEQAMFLITTQENRHIFDNFRRNRTTFSVRGAADRSFGRYNEKLVNISGGIAFLSNIYKNFAAAAGYSWDTLWPSIINETAKEQVLAASIAFDHLTRQLARPEDGPHFQRAAGFADPVLRSTKDPDGPSGRSVVTVPNGTTGYLRDVGIGGRPIENSLSDEHGDYDSRYVQNAGSYYDKINSIFHLSISEDRFISQSRGDFVDARARANGMADIFPDGWRRVVANSLTGDKAAMAPFVAADMGNRPLADISGFPSRPMGWTSWWPGNGPEVCFASNGRNACAAPEGSGLALHPDAPAKMLPVDPEIGWEVQKFVIVYSLALVLANEHAQWKDMMELYKLGANTDPGIANRIEWQDPVSGTVYFARTYGTECLFGAGAACTGGKIVQKGIAARVVEWANTLTAKAYKLNTTVFPARPGFVAGHNDFGRPMVVRHPDGTPVIVSDPAMKQITPEGGVGTPKPDCDQNVAPTCDPLSKYDNRWAVELDSYKSVPDFLWEVGQVFGIGHLHQLGLYP